MIRDEAADRHGPVSMLEDHPHDEIGSICAKSSMIGRTEITTPLSAHERTRRYRRVRF
ncbi:hypothetical protein [Exiguobacterium mexicanum]|uniref:hypothetical protein n=1 Tax=Exiguobacterium mexicanum TaxID=340146 RepID=UPI0037C11634